jgi:hypothetical protein
MSVVFFCSLSICESTLIDSRKWPYININVFSKHSMPYKLSNFSRTQAKWTIRCLWISQTSFTLHSYVERCFWNKNEKPILVFKKNLKTFYLTFLAEEGKKKLDILLLFHHSLTFPSKQYFLFYLLFLLCVFSSK